MQNKVKEFNKNFDSQPSSVRMLDIVSEVGELSKEVIKSQNYGKKDFSVNNDIMLETGDVLYAILSFCNENNIDAEKCLDMVLEKYSKRFNLNGTLDSKGKKYS